jgi:hypothetical protein
MGQWFVTVSFSRGKFVAEGDREITPFCIGCGAWIEAADEMNVSPWHYCEWCTPKKPVKIRVTKKYRN